MNRGLFTLMLGLILAGCQTAPATHPSPNQEPWPALDSSPLAKQAFLGVAVKPQAAAGDVEIMSVLPGPLTPGGGARATLQVEKGDIILAVNGNPLSGAELRALVAHAHPGDRLRLRVRRPEKAGTPDHAATQPSCNPDTGAIHDVEVVLDPKSRWSGPISFPRPAGPSPDSPANLELPDDSGPLERFIDAQAARTDMKSDVDRLLNYFAKTQSEQGGFHMLGRVAYGFQHPMRLPALQRAITKPMPDIAMDPRLALISAADNLDVPRPALSNVPDLSDPTTALHWMAAHVEEAQCDLDRAFAALTPRQRAELPQRMEDLLDLQSQLEDISDSPEPRRLIQTMQATMSVEYGAVLQAAGELSGLMIKSSPPPANLKAIKLPPELVGAVTGDILAAEQVHGRWYVYGGYGKNSYDMSRIDVVIDPGGGDEFRYPSDGRLPRQGVQVVVDMGGNDRYIGAKRGGPGGALMGVNLIVDYGANNHYEGGLGSCGAGVLGDGIIVNYGGASSYTATAISEGAAYYGLGALIDLGKENHLYQAQVLSQGVGGPRGFGLLLVDGGRNLFRANGPVESAYNTPAVFCSFSQGIGIGIRGFDSGGIGVLADLGGGGRYEGGEFCQGGAYYWGLGILYGGRGGNLYYGNRYSQGWAAHQGLGVLANDGGNNIYWGMTAASQGVGWDIAMGLLIDRGSHNAYQADGLSQGSAAMQGIGWLIDEGDGERFVALDIPAQGQTGSNEYHFTESHCLSWGMLLHAGGPSYFSAGRAQQSSIAVGPQDGSPTEKSRLHGLFVDTRRNIELP